MQHREWLKRDCTGLKQDLTGIITWRFAPRGGPNILMVVQACYKTAKPAQFAFSTPLLYRFVTINLNMKLLSLLAASALAEFNSQPTGGARVCDFYTLKAKAIFDNGFTEDNASAMHNGATKVR